MTGAGVKPFLMPLCYANIAKSGTATGAAVLIARDGTGGAKIVMSQEIAPSKPWTSFVPRAAGAMSVVITGAVLLGWSLEIERLKRISVAFVAMNPTAALCFMVLGFALIGLPSPRLTKGLRLFVGAVIGVLGAIKLVSLAGFISAPFDVILFAQHGATNPIAYNTALSFVLLGISVGALAVGSGAAVIVGQTAAFAAALIALTALVGYGAGIIGLYDPGNSPMALHVGVLMLLLSVGLLVETLQKGLLKTAPDQAPGKDTALPFSPRLLTLSFIALLVVIAAAVWGERQTIRHAELTFETRTRELDALRLLSLLQDTEAGEQGFLLTGNPRYLDPYSAAIPQIAALQMKFRDVTADKAEAQARAQRLDAAVDDLLAIFAQAIDLGRRNDKDAALAIVNTDRGKERMDEIRGIVAEANANLAEELAGRQVQLTRITSAIEVTEGVGLLMIALMAAMIFNQSKSATQAQAAAAKAAIAATRSKSAFLATMSHELRTPMTAILGMCDLLSLAKLNAEEREITRVLTRSAQSLLALLNDILDLSKIEAGRLTIEKADFRLSGILEDAKFLFLPAASQKGILFDIETFGASGDVFRGDPKRLRQVLFNLVGNAIKFTDEGSVRVRLTQRMIDANTTGLEIAVIDTGAGIGEEAKSRLFREFEQEDASTSRRFGGTGLGLVICKQIVEAMGGTIGVESKKGDGSRFFFEVALPSGDAAAVVSKDTVTPHASGANLDGLNLQILLAEDTIATQFLLSKMLEMWGHTVVVVANGAEAVRAANERGWDIILMDMQMPVMDGQQATAAIRGGNGPSANTPIIALTADAITENHREYLKAGCNLVATKPVEWATLARQMALLLESRPRTPFAAARNEGAVGDAVSGNAVTTGLVDEDLFDEMSGALGAAFVPLVQAAIEDFKQYLSEIQQAVAAADLPQVRRVAHKIRGISAQIGASRIAKIAAAIEEGAQGLPEAASEIARLNSYIGLTNAALQSRLKKNQEVAAE